MRNKISLLSLSFFLVACNGVDDQKGEVKNGLPIPAAAVTKTVWDAVPALATADSIQVLFYDNTGGDSLRYTRYFTVAETADTASIKALVREMNGVYVQEPRVRSCRSEGKLHLYRGEDVVKTVYFSVQTEGCRYFYFIQNGVFMYFPLTEPAAVWLETMRQKARKP